MAEEQILGKAINSCPNELDMPTYCQGFSDGYHECQKEHEWHSVIDGDLPKHNHEVLCLMWGGTKEIGYYENEVWHFENFVADYEDVDYWQEIVPPKESE